MAQITFEEAQKIVENAMRVAGYGNVEAFENAWKDSLVTQVGTVNLSMNLKNLRDAIARSIVDILTHTQATNTISTGNIPGTTGIVRINTDINLKNQIPITNPVSILTPLDPTLNTTLLVWINQVSAALIALGYVNVPPTIINGKINSGSII